MAFQPYYFKNVDLILGEEATGNNFKCQLRSIVLTPDTNVQTSTTGCPEGVYTFVDTATWTLDLGYLYGRDTEAAEKALARFLYDNQGKIVPFTFRPWSGEDDEGWTGKVRILAGPVGGEQGSVSEQSVSLPLEGQPIPLTEADLVP